MSNADIRVALGRTSSGKSYLLRFQLADHRRVVIFDPNREAANAIGATVCETPSQLYNVLKAGGDFRVCYRAFPRTNEAEDLAAFDLANRMIYAVGNLTVMWEEIDFFCARNLHGAAYPIIHAGRHRGLKVFAAARRPANVPRDLTSQASRLICFNFSEPNDLKYVAEYMGRKAAETVASAPARHAVDWSPAGWKLKKSPFR